MDGASVETVTLGEKGLTVPLEGGVPAYFNYWWLRDNCPTSFDRETRERTFDIFHLDALPVPATARLADAALEIDWQGEEHRSRYPLDWLAGYARGEPRPDPADLPRRP